MVAQGVGVARFALWALGERTPPVATSATPAGECDVADEEGHEDDPGDQHDQRDRGDGTRPHTSCGRGLLAARRRLEDGAVERDGPLQRTVVEDLGIGFRLDDFSRQRQSQRGAHRIQRVRLGRFETIGERGVADGGEQVGVGEGVESVGEPEVGARGVRGAVAVLTPPDDGVVERWTEAAQEVGRLVLALEIVRQNQDCLLYTSDAADDWLVV